MYEMGKAEIDAVIKVLKSKQFMRYRGGEEGYTQLFEKELQENFKIRHALAVNSGTSALICALAAMGIGPGDEVIVPAYTWVATAMAVLAVGAVPVMADIDESLTIDPQDIERRITPYTRAVIPVHIINHVCNMDAIMELAEKHHLLVCEDACQAIGVTYKNKRVGTIGHTGAYSFNQFKNISCGEGGMVVTNDERYYERALMYHDAGCFTRTHASTIKEPFFPGVNYRVSEIQGAIMHEQFKRLDGILSNLKADRKIMAQVFAKSEIFRIVLHHDEAEAVNIAGIFPDADSAKAYSEKHHIPRIIESGRHIYTNWEPLLEQRSFHPKMNPFNWAHRKIEYTPDMCQKTLDILARTVNFSVGTPYNTGSDAVRENAEKLVS